MLLDIANVIGGTAAIALIVFPVAMIIWAAKYSNNKEQ